MLAAGRGRSPGIFVLHRLANTVGGHHLGVRPPGEYVDEINDVYGEPRRVGPRLRRASLLAWLVGWVLVFCLLPPHGEASSAPGALEVSGDEITYNGSPVPFLFY